MKLLRWHGRNCWILASAFTEKKMARNFPNWIEAYCDYAADGFVPPQFNEWAALSAVAAALERKVWLPWGDTFNFYPNLYVLCVSMPGIGKSTALNKAVD